MATQPQPHVREAVRPTLNLSPQPLPERSLKERYYSLELLKSPKSGRNVARVMIGLGILTLLILFLPWQQNVTGTGRLTALRPQDRPQDVPSVIPGQIMQWYVQEGDTVKAGQPLVRIAEVKDKYFDPKTLQRIQEQTASKTEAYNAKRQKAEALQRQIATLRESLRLKLSQTRNKVLQAQNKVAIDSAELTNARVALEIAERQFQGQKALYDKGLKSLTDLEQRRGKLQEATAKLQSAENKLLLSRNELINARIEINGVQADYQEKIAKAQSDLSATLADASETEAEVAKMQNEVANIEIRNGFYVLRSPINGIVVRALKEGIGEQVSAQEPVVTVTPLAPQRAVELYVTATDVPLITPGRKVRLEFDGWPVIQFSGWPSISVGTFGGEVQVVDFVNSVDGRYRILVVPDLNDDPWPPANRLRVGSGVRGWAMLDEVPVWFEIWRQLNGFPPSLSAPPTEKSNDKAKAKASKEDE